MKPSENCLRLIQHFEGCKLSSYLDSVSTATIGWGCTFYEDGQRVKIGDVITQERADELLIFHLNDFGQNVSKQVKSNINQNQFDALTDFAYNLGLGNLHTSTLLKKVNIEPDDSTIEQEFLKWNKAGGQVLKGLTLRRQAEAILYFTGELLFT